MKQLTLINDDSVDKKVRIYENSKLIRRFVNRKGKTVTDLTESSQVKVVIKNQTSIIVTIIKYVFLYLNGTVTGQLSDVAKYDVIMVDSLHTDMTIRYSDKTIDVLGDMPYTHQTRYNDKLGVVVVMVVGAIIMASVFILIKWLLNNV